MRKQYITLIAVLLLLTMALFVAGCGGPPVYAGGNQNGSPNNNQNQQVQATTVQTIGDTYILAKNWDADPEVDGLQFDLYPKDVNDASVETSGKISIKLWKQVEVNYETKCLKRDQDLLEAWSDIPIKESDYSLGSVTVRAEYKTYQLTSDEYATGCAEITFTTPDGKNFVALVKDIYVNGL